MESSQYLTAVFEMRPSRRKAVVLERIRSKAEDITWAVIENARVGVLRRVFVLQKNQMAKHIRNNYYKTSKECQAQPMAKIIKEKSTWKT